jgi:antitoxin component of MazEF toxin-antitoxin module
MVQVSVGQWGKDLAVRLLAAIVDALKLRDSERVEIEVQGGETVVRGTPPRVSLEDLFQGRSPD